MIVRNISVIHRYIVSSLTITVVMHMLLGSGYSVDMKSSGGENPVASFPTLKSSQPPAG